MNAGEILKTAADIVANDRAEVHGDMHVTMRRIAELWSSYLGAHVSASDAAAMMVLLKLARAKNGKPVDDHFVDMAGYAAIAGAVRDE